MNARSHAVDGFYLTYITFSPSYASSAGTTVNLTLQIQASDIHNVNVNSVYGTFTYLSGDTNANGVLNYNEEWVYTAVYIVTTDAINGNGLDVNGIPDGDYDIDFSADITGLDVSNNPVSAMATYYGYNVFQIYSDDPTADTDGDGVPNGDEWNDDSDPLDPCDFVVEHISLSPSPAWFSTDCDQDGVTNGVEIENGTNPHDPCDYIVADITVPNTAGDDCDGDGVLDVTELANGTDPHDPCDYNVADVTHANTADEDCDGDGVLDTNELAEGTNPHDPCSYHPESISETPSVYCNYNLIQGQVRLDMDTNGCSSTDVQLSGFPVQTTDGSNIYTTYSQNGGYFLPVTLGSYTTSVISNYPYVNVVTSPYSDNFSTLNNTVAHDFCLMPNTTVNDANIVLYPIGLARPGFNANYKLIFRNVGTTTLNGSVSLQFDDSKLSFVSSNISVSSLTSNTLTFDYTDLHPFQNREINLTFSVFAPPIVESGDILVFTSHIEPVSGDLTPIDNTFTYPQNVVNSLDPNDMEVLEGEEVLIENADEFLHYLIRFQNIGSASAIHVRVENQLDTHLDDATLQMEYISHPCVVTLTNGTDLKFDFENIELPGNYDEPHSHGYIAYKIKPKSTIAVGNHIPNLANIYFDFNAAIPTNSVSTTFVNSLGIEDSIENQIQLSPNPVQDIMFIYGNFKPKNASIYSVLGILVDQVHSENGITQLDLSLLNTGFYSITFTDEQQLQVTKKILVSHH
ncbi:MAG: T9SS type A sorting domain-containing protein [Flavobacteriaceae bacterium]|nr:T9SS type A sorting domain-containing protein [Flavobacteriaceae bacterium]